MIHKYTLMGCYIVLDVGSGAVHVTDELTYDLLDCLEPPLGGKLPWEALRKLGDKYPAENLEEAYGELTRLWQEGALFAEAEYELFADKLSPSPVKALCLNVSHDCNLRCAYCFAGKGDYRQGRTVMSAETGKKAIDYLIEHSQDRRELEVDFFGGEPLLNFEVVKQVVEYARSLEKERSKAFRFTITTNGLLLDDAKIDYINREMSNIVLSLDGRKSVNDKVRTRPDGSGCYDAVVSKFQRLVSMRDGEYYLRGTFTGYNKDFSRDVLALRGLGFEQVSIEPVVAGPGEPYALTEADLPEILAEYEHLATLLLREREAGNYINFFHFMLDLNEGPCAIKRLRGCGCGNEYLAVVPGGDVYPCHQFVGQEGWKMGNVHADTLDWSVKKYFSGCTVYQKQECSVCWARFYCSGGCNANNFQYMGDVRRPLPLSCEMEKKRVECAIALQAKSMVTENENVGR